MKKLLAIPFAFLLASALVGCGMNTASENRDRVEDRHIIDENVHDERNNNLNTNDRINGTGNNHNTVGDEPLNRNGNLNKNEVITEEGMGTHNNGVNNNGTNEPIINGTGGNATGVPAVPGVPGTEGTKGTTNRPSAGG